MKTFIAAAVVAATSFVAAFPAHAYERWVDIENRGRSRIYSVQISNVADPYYGRDLLGDRAIPVGDRFRVEPDVHQGYCRFDVKITFENGSVVTRSRVNLCAAARLIVNERGTRIINA